MPSGDHYNVRDYARVIDHHRNKTGDEDAAFHRAVGGAFEGEGQFQAELVRAHAPDGPYTLFDLGCGAGRAAYGLREEAQLTYYGVDIMADLLAYGREKAAREDWRFEVQSGFTLAADDDWADMMLVMSVFTHIHHAETRQYLSEVARVIKPGGKLIVSFLEAGNPLHTKQFYPAPVRWALRQLGRDVLVTFMRRDQISGWVTEAGFTVEEIVDYAPVARQHTLVARRAG
ncbi:MAG: class I SAM-dependent methyltransferase [Pseudomonadota bacterium]